MTEKHLDSMPLLQPLSPHILPWLILFHPQWSPPCPLNIPGVLPPQSLCTCCFLCFRYSFPRQSHAWLPHFFQELTQTSLSQQAFLGHPYKMTTHHTHFLSPFLLYFSAQHLSLSNLSSILPYFVHLSLSEDKLNAGGQRFLSVLYTAVLTASRTLLTHKVAVQ